jgi:hypothetical protein
MVRAAAIVTALLTLCTALFVYLRSEDQSMERQNSSGTTVLSIGLDPGAVDYSRYPHIDAATLTARIAAGETALRDAGFDLVSCQVPADPDAAEHIGEGHTLVIGFAERIGERMAADRERRKTGLLDEIRRPGVPHRGQDHRVTGAMECEECGGLLGQCGHRTDPAVPGPGSAPAVACRRPGRGRRRQDGPV